MKEQPPKRILILMADTGLGHRSAAKAIAAAVQELHGDACNVDIVNPLEAQFVPKLLHHSQADYDRLVRQMPELYKLGYNLSDGRAQMALVDSALAVMLFEAMYEVLRIYQPHVIVSVHPMFHAPLRAVYAITRRPIPLLTVITDLTSIHHMWFHQASDWCLTPTEAARELALEAGLAPDKIKLTGIPIHPNFVHETRAKAAIRAELGWQPNLHTVLVTGSKRVGNLSETLRALNHSGFPLHLILVAGGDELLFQQFQQTEWHVPVSLFNFVQNMPTLMHAADFIMCKAGGLTVTEALACGLPLLLVDALPGQETGNAEYVVQGGAGELGTEPLAALEIVAHWLAHHGAQLAQRAQQARQLGRPRAAYDVANYVWQAALHGPPRKTQRRIRDLSKLLPSQIAKAKDSILKIYRKDVETQRELYEQHKQLN